MPTLKVDESITENRVKRGGKTPKIKNKKNFKKIKKRY